MARNKETKLTSLSQAAVNFSTIDGCIARVTEKAVGKKKEQNTANQKVERKKEKETQGDRRSAQKRR